VTTDSREFFSLLITAWKQSHKTFRQRTRHITSRGRHESLLCKYHTAVDYYANLHLLHHGAGATCVRKTRLFWMSLSYSFIAGHEYMGGSCAQDIRRLKYAHNQRHRRCHVLLGFLVESHEYGNTQFVTRETRNMYIDRARKTTNTSPNTIMLKLSHISILWSADVLT
jgi:hypothetical protein